MAHPPVEFLGQSGAARNVVVGYGTCSRATLFYVKQNVTLSLPADTVRKLKVLAAQRGTSISRMLTERLEEILSRDEEYERARRRSLTRLGQGWNLGLSERRDWTRDELHER